MLNRKVNVSLIALGLTVLLLDTDTASDTKEMNDDEFVVVVGPPPYTWW